MDTGQRIGGYEIVARLKAGGMATLYLARRQGAAGFARHVAIKVVHPHLAQDDTFVRMFVDEAKLSARIEHPNVVHVEELGEEAGRYFLVMEYVHGCSLAQLVRALARLERRLAIDLAIHIAMKVADGLHAAHEATSDEGESLGVVHRDVSPQNVLLAYKGYVKLIDFGIAKARGRAQETATRTLKGKLRYMAPEQAFGRRVDRRTDIYALGVVLWELLTMRKLFDAEDDFALLEKVRTPNVPLPSKLAPDIPSALDDAVLWALSPSPDYRPPTALALRNRLAEAVPTASRIDAAQVSELLRAVMTDEIEKQRQALPESVSKIMRDEARMAASQDGRAPSAPLRPGRFETELSMAIGALTTSAHGLAIDIADPDDPDSADREARSADSPPAGFDTSVVNSAISRAPERSRLWMVAAAVIAVGIGVGAFALGQRTGAGSRDDDPLRGAGNPSTLTTAAAHAGSPAGTPTEPSVPSPPPIAPDAGPPPDTHDAAIASDAGVAQPRITDRTRRPPSRGRTKRSPAGGDGVPLISEPSW